MQFERSLESDQISVRRIIFTSTRSLRACLDRGLGIALFPEMVVADDIRDGRLIRLDWPNAPTETTMLMIRHAEKWCSPMLRAFIDTCLSVFAVEE